MRCFVAFELTDSAREEIFSRMDRLRQVAEEVLGADGIHREWRPVRRENGHVTLLFFPGLTAPQRHAVWKQVEESVRQGVWRGLTFSWRGFSLWPSARRPNLICLEADPYPLEERWPLTQWVSQPPFCGPDGLPLADVRHLNPFRPHITLVRFRGQGGRNVAAVWPEWMARIPPLDPVRIAVDRVAMMLSDLTPDKPAYTREYSMSMVGDE
ncbi:MAG: hypothetical protein OEV94_07115 [Deltaproteobacteria bacterium]|nr:hypothetical protein [Deltaproteobacteria bacterium]